MLVFGKKFWNFEGNCAFTKTTVFKFGGLLAGKLTFFQAVLLMIIPIIYHFILVVLSTLCVFEMNHLFLLILNNATFVLFILEIICNQKQVAKLICVSIDDSIYDAENNGIKYAKKNLNYVDGEHK